jgi:NADH-quinone oxidoreductase subunit M
MFQRVNYGEVTNENNAVLPDLNRREWTVLVPIVAMTVIMGVLPTAFLRPMEPSVNHMLSLMQRSTALRAAASSQPSAIGPQPSAISHQP